ncbi:MAG: GntR family transcriptional regulator [Rhodobacteraceae bacterium]|nr:GntR family transcriptional regulator [Paracoccaceae bacterium]MCY4198038.1 GntR family transcriptional regulator [Paracoccaceae bacterium]MCY4328154.1 GntR family transcriptional regulator [Paracoccaceae bacterium]
MKLNLSDADLRINRPRITLVQVVADKLREFILLEKLPQGAAISEREVAAALGISRTPLRGALSLLEQEGLVEYTVTRRPRVTRPSLEEISENLLVMGVIEALGGELACAAATDDDIAHISNLHNKMQNSAELDSLEFFRTDMEFHKAIIGLSGNKSLIETHRQYNGRLWRARFISSRRSAGRGKTLREHAAIFEGLRKRDPIKTAMAMRKHMDSAIHNLKVALAERETSDSEQS